MNRNQKLNLLYIQDVCIGPIIKYAVFDAFFGVVCALLLIFGAHLRNNCLLISWVVITICTSLKYVYVVVVSDWSRLEVKKKKFWLRKGQALLTEFTFYGAYTLN